MYVWGLVYILSQAFVLPKGYICCFHMKTWFFRLPISFLTSVTTSTKHWKINLFSHFLLPYFYPTQHSNHPQTLVKSTFSRNQSKINIYIEINHHINIKLTISKSLRTLVNKAFSVKIKTPALPSLRSRQIQHNFYHFNPILNTKITLTENNHSSCNPLVLHMPISHYPISLD